MPKLELHNVIIKQLEDQKVEDIVCMDTSRISSLADHVIIGSGRSGKHAEASMENLKAFLKQKYGILGQIDGSGSDGWVVLDLGNIIIHIFEPAVRTIYKLEELFESRAKKLMVKEAKKDIKKSLEKSSSTKKVAKSTTKKPSVKKSPAKKVIVKKIAPKKISIKKPVIKAKKLTTKKVVTKKSTVKAVAKKK
ncbi:MAG: ribosome silencing factor [Rickettsiales bacterium]|nr:ribosome silencing factor [Rickettsiales bacterium]